MAQKTAINDNKYNAYRLGMELFEKEKYGAAQNAFKKAAGEVPDPNADLRVNAEYYVALCALKLFNRDAEYLFNRFIEDHSENPSVRYAYFQLGVYKFRNKSYSKAIEWFNKVDVYDLNNEELSEYYFKLGYSYFVKEDYERARKLFYEIKDADTKYSNPATYYYSHISYLNHNYETALQGFEKLSAGGGFQSVVPYYIAQIYYLQKKYEKLIEYAQPLLDSANRPSDASTQAGNKRIPEIARLIGESYYATDQYEKSIPYLKRYLDEAPHVVRSDVYQLAYAYYKIEDYTKAVNLFKQVVNQQDLLAHQAYYHLGYCYFLNGDKEFARLTFRTASKMEFDLNIQEDAAFNYAKLSYDLNMNPIFALTGYIEKYPENIRVGEAYEYLSAVYFTTKNYKKALQALDKITDKNIKLKEAYQRIAYNRGVELFNDENMQEALALFDKSLNYSYDKNIEALCYYWKGDALYRLKKYDLAVKSYEQFIYAPASFSLPLFNTVNYDLGYAYFQLADYANSNTWFRKFVRHITPVFEEKISKNDPDTSVGMKEVFSKECDAFLRIADGYFVNKDYQTSVEYYNMAIEFFPDSLSKMGYKLTDMDYARFQNGLVYGVMGNQENKVKVLRKMLEAYPNSTYTDDAKYELAKSYTVLHIPDSAILWYRNIVEEHPNSSYVPKSMLNMGLEYYNKNENEIALVTFKRVIMNYPATAEANEALVGIKNIYVEIGDVESYADYVGGLSFANITRASLDSTTYEAAELYYMRGDCERAIKDFSKYLEKFEDGYFALNANFYKSECLVKRSDSSASMDAIEGYNFVIANKKNTFTEKALMRTAGIYYQYMNYPKAIESYQELEKIAEYKNHITEARIGLMRSYFLLKDYKSAIASAAIVLATEKLSNDVESEAHFIIAKSGLETDDYNLALKEFEITQQKTRSEMGAAALYYAAYIQYLRSEHDSSEKLIFKLAQRKPSYDYWITKGFILLADNYLQIGNLFQARATLQSVIDNSENTELAITAKEKLDKIKETETDAKLKQEKSSSDIDVQFEDYNIEYDKLFNDNDEDGAEEKAGRDTTDTTKPGKEN